MRFELPDDVSKYWADENKLVGCNRLFCRSCKSWVRHVDQRKIGHEPDTSEENEWLYEHLGEAGEPILTTRVGGDECRAYVCRCAVDYSAGYKMVQQTDNSWRCAGHPQ
jgi:hypothetical protein